MDPQLDQIIESLLFASPEPIESKEIARLVRNVAKRQAAEAAEEAAAEAAASEYDDELEADEEPAAEADVDETDDHEDKETAEEEETEEEGEDEDEEMRMRSQQMMTARDEAADEEPSAEINLSKLSAAQVDQAIDALNAYYDEHGSRLCGSRPPERMEVLFSSRVFALVARTVSGQAERAP